MLFCEVGDTRERTAMDITTRYQAEELLEKCNSNILKCERQMADAIALGREDYLVQLFDYRIDLAGQKGKLEYMLTIL